MILSTIAVDMSNWSKDLTLEQGTDAWLSARSRRLGGSEIASVMRLSPYKTRRELWEEKVGIRESKSISHLPHVKRGIDAEPIARDIIERTLHVKYETPVMVDTEHPWMVASLDGLCDDHTLEIKTMSESKHNDTAWGWVPEYYECQVQWGLMIAHRSRGMFASYRPEDGTLYWTWIERDKNRIQAMRKAAIEFWGWVEERIEPPEDFAWTPEV